MLQTTKAYRVVEYCSTDPSWCVTVGQLYLRKGDAIRKMGKKQPHTNKFEELEYDLINPTVVASTKEGV